MEILYPIIFKNKSEILDKNANISAKASLKKLVSILTNQNNFEIRKFGSNNFVINTPSDYELLTQKPRFIVDFLNGKIIENKSVFINGRFTRDNFSFFIDVSTVKREPILFSIMLQLSTLLSNDKKEFRIILLISDLTTSFITTNSFKDLIDNRQLLLIDLNGKIEPRKIVKNIHYNEFLLSLRQAQPTLEELVYQKLITKIGHFKHLDNRTKEMCFRTYIDGQFCKDELVELISNFIEKNFKVKKLFTIIYYAKYSVWLKEIIYIVSMKYSLNGHIDVLSLNEQSCETLFSKSDKNSVVLFLTDLINSGFTFQEHHRIIHSYLGKYSYKTIKYLSICNSGITPVQKLRRLVFSGNVVEINYLVNVKIIESHENDCILCKLNIPTEDFSNNARLTLSSYDFWELFLNSNYGVEGFGPKNRVKLKTFPNVYSLIENNGSFIAYKFKLLLEAYDISIYNICLVLPDESKRGKIFNETPSGRFAAYLNFIFDVEYLEIPRKIIDYYYDHSLDDFKSANIQLSQDLRNLSKDIIIVDEAQVEGFTFTTLKKILTYFHKPPIAYFPLIDFNPVVTKNNAAKFAEMKFLNLYQFQL